LEFGNSVYWISFGEEYAEKVNFGKIFIIFSLSSSIVTDPFVCFDDGVEIPCIQTIWYQLQVSLRGNSGNSFSLI